MLTPHCRNLPRAARLWLVLLALTMPAVAQGEAPKKDKPDYRDWDPIEKGLNPDGDLYPVKYTVDAKGRLWMSPSPSAGDAEGKELVFPARLRRWRSMTANLGLAGWLRCVFSGNQDLASLSDADYHFRQLELGRTDMELRQRLARLAEGKTPELRRRAELDRLLAVRLVQQGRVTGARKELELLAKNAAVSPFLRAAAEDALHSLWPGRYARARLPEPKSAAILRAMPAGGQVVVTIDQQRVPRWPGILTFARSVGNAMTLKHIRMAGGRVSPPMLAGAQKLAAAPGLLPYEVARRLGNARIQRTTVALRFPADVPLPMFWVRFDGIIPAETLKAALNEDGYELKAMEKSQTGFSADMGIGLLLECDATHLTLRTADWPVQGAGMDAERLLAAGFGKPPFWLHLPDGKALLELVKGTPLAVAIPKFTRATLTGAFQDDASCKLQLRMPEGREATTMLRQLETWLRMGRALAGNKEQELLAKILAKVELEEDADDDKLIRAEWQPGDLTLAMLVEMIAGN